MVRNRNSDARCGTGLQMVRRCAVQSRTGKLVRVPTAGVRMDKGRSILRGFVHIYFTSTNLFLVIYKTNAIIILWTASFKNFLVSLDRKSKHGLLTMRRTL